MPDLVPGAELTAEAKQCLSATRQNQRSKCHRGAPVFSLYERLICQPLQKFSDPGLMWLYLTHLLGPNLALDSIILSVIWICPLAREWSLLRARRVVPHREQPARYSGNLLR